MIQSVHKFVATNKKGFGNQSSKGIIILGDTFSDFILKLLFKSSKSNFSLKLMNEFKIILIKKVIKFLLYL